MVNANEASMQLFCFVSRLVGIVIFLTIPRVCLQFVIKVFPDLIHWFWYHCICVWEFSLGLIFVM